MQLSSVLFLMFLASVTVTFVDAHNISVIHISNVLSSHVAAAPTPEPSAMSLTDTMSAHGCKMFADALLANPEASKTYQGNIDGGLSVFCPVDDQFKGFLPKFKNLTAADKVSFLEFFGVPIYQSLSTLRSNNGVMNTLATDGANKFDFEVQNDGDDVTLKTTTVTAKIRRTLIDEPPLSIYTIDKVLLPEELFKPTPTPTPAPAPAPEKAADSPKPSKDTKKPVSDAPTDSPADAPADHAAADQTADDSAGVRFGVGRLVGLVFSLCTGLLLL